MFKNEKFWFVLSMIFLLTGIVLMSIKFFIYKYSEVLFMVGLDMVTVGNIITGLRLNAKNEEKENKEKKNESDKNKQD